MHTHTPPPDYQRVRHERDILRNVIQNRAHRHCANCKGTGLDRADLCLCVIGGDDMAVRMAS
ncbi:MAG: hypothetical protein WKG03_00495 [Telluria sp.]